MTAARSRLIAGRVGRVTADDGDAERFRAVELETGRWTSSKLWTLTVSSDGLASLRRLGSSPYTASRSDSAVEVVDQQGECRLVFRDRVHGAVRFAVRVGGGVKRREALTSALERAGFTSA